MVILVITQVQGSRFTVFRLALSIFLVTFMLKPELEKGEGEGKGWRREREQKLDAEFLIQLLILSTIFFFFSASLCAALTIHPLYLALFLERPDLVGLVASITSLAGLTFSLPTGLLSDKTGRKKLLIASFLLVSTVLFLFSLNTSLYLLILLQIAFGIAKVLARVTSEALVKYLSPIKRRGEFRSVFGTFASAGIFIGTITGGFIAYQFDIRTTYIFAAPLLLLLLVLVFKLNDNNCNGNIRKRASNETGRGEILTLLKEFLEQRELKALLFCTVSLFSWYSAKWVFGPLFLHYLGYSPFIIGVWIGLSIIPFLIFQILVGKLADRIGKSRLILIGFVISTIFIIPLGFMQSLAGLLITITIISLGTTFIDPLIEARVTDIVPRERYGAYSGIFESAKNLGFMLGLVSSAIFVYLFDITYSFIPPVILFILTLALCKIWLN